MSKYGISSLEWKLCPVNINLNLWHKLLGRNLEFSKQESTMAFRKAIGTLLSCRRFVAAKKPTVWV